ncbi:MAG: ATP-dependent protease ATPase subunit HslU [Myxococcota bacterium]
MSQSTTVRTPREIVSELDRYIVGQQSAKRAVAIALRNRWRRKQIDPRLREEVSPKNIILMGPTGCGKTEIARRLANQDQSPFVKVEATKFTEVGYMGRDVDSMVRDLVECAVKICREQELKKVQQRSQELAQQRLVDLLLPKASPPKESFDVRDASGETPQVDDEQMQHTRQKVLEMLQAGAFDDREVSVQVLQKQSSPMMHLFAPSAMEDMASNLQDALQSALGPGKKKQRKMKVPQALRTLAAQEAQKLIDTEQVHQKAVALAEESGILFIDEIDKIASRSEKARGPDVSREGVQRDILPIVEGCSVPTKYGVVKTDHILFIAAGAFHTSKPSDLIPELQGRFPIRVQLEPLGEEDFRRILVEPESSLIKQYRALLAVEGVDLRFTDDGLAEIAHMAVAANALHENIGARRLYTVLEKLLEEESFAATDQPNTQVVIDRACVQKRLQPILSSEDLSKFIL